MKKISLPVSVNNLIKSLDKKTDFSPSEIRKILDSANISADSLMPWANFDHDINDGYGRALIHATEHYEIMVMSWMPRDYSAIHNHGYTEWGAVQVFGKLEHRCFRLDKENHLTTLLKEKLEVGEIIVVNQNLIHQMGNPYDEKALSLHVYGTTQNPDNVTDNSQLYEIGKGEIQLVNGGVFYDLKNNSINNRKSGLTSDRLTEISHYCSLLNHYLKSDQQGPQYKQAVSYFQDRSFENRLSFEVEMDSQRILYLIELKKARKLLYKLKESCKTIDEIILEINDMEKYS